MRVLVVDSPETSLPPGATELLGDIGWQVVTAPDWAVAAQRARSGDVDAVILGEPGRESGEAPRRQFQELLHVVEARRIAAIMISEHGPPVGDQNSLVNVVDSHISLAELRGQLTVIERYHRLLKRLEGELQNMERLSERLHHHFQEVDQELRLAARLQRDFLPDLSRPFGNLRAAAIYRPASWVSGDMFDVFRIDEDRTGIYIVDAVGHGMAASLLTMFIKRAVVPTHGHGDELTVLDPAQVMSALNDALADQALPNCQFVTACYGLFHRSTREFHFARGGHPYPLLISPVSGLSELQAPGGLLGLTRGEQFVSYGAVLDPGDKLLLYTDGIELCFQDSSAESPDGRAFHRVFASLAALPIDAMMDQVELQLNSQSNFTGPRDDLTVLGLEVLPS